MKFLKTLVLALVAAVTIGAGLGAQVPQVAIGNLGPVYYAERYGVVCTDNTATADLQATNNTTKLQALNDLIIARGDSTGVIQLPGGLYCSINGTLKIGTVTPGVTGHVSFLGRGLQSTNLRWTGLNGQSVGTPAVFVTRNKGFKIGQFYLSNVSSDVVSQYDTNSNLGMRFGGNASGGTQTFAFIATQMGLNHWDTGIQLGANNGSAASDSIFDELTLEHNNTAYNSLGNSNSLDIYFRNLLMGFNKIGIASSTGNIQVYGGSASYNGIDFKSNGFGYFTVENMRSEGPGRFFWGAEPHVVLRNITIAEIQGSRTSDSIVTCAPDNARAINLTVFTASPANGPYPIEFSTSDLTGTDTTRPVFINLSNGSTVAGELATITSTTTGTVSLVSKSTSPAIQSDTNVTLTIYDTATCDLRFTASTVTSNDAGAAFMLPSASSTTIYGGLAKVWVNSVSSTTAGKGFMSGTYGGNVPLLATQPGALTAAEGAAGNVNVGTHKYYVTCVVNGIETKGGVEGTVTVSASAKQVDLSAIPTCTDATARHVYRTAAGVTGVTNAKLLTNGIIADNVTTVLTDNDTDATLASGHPGDDVSRSFDEDPYIFDNIAIEWTAAQYQLTIENLNSFGAIKVRDGNNSGEMGNLRISNSKTHSAPVGLSQVPIMITQASGEWQITGTAASIPSVASASGTIHTTGIPFGGSTVDQSSAQMRSNLLINSIGNSAALYADIEYALPDFIGRLFHGRFEPFIYMTRAIQGNGATGDSNGNQFASGIGIRPEMQLSRVASLGEAAWANGKNLRTWCQFAAATTCAVDFKRDESVTFNATGSDVTNRDRTIRWVVTSGHFDIADLGKVTTVPVTISASVGLRTAYGFISRIEDATHVWTERSAGEIAQGTQGAGSYSATATIGEDEPDANYMVWLSCDDTAVTFKAGSLATTGFTITASGSTSALCRALIIR